MLTPRRFALSLAVPLALAALAGCSGSDVKAAESDTTSTVAGDGSGTEDQDNEETELPSDDDVEAYFEAVLSEDPAELEAARALAGPGSNADSFITDQLAIANAAIDVGYSDPIETLTKIDDGYESCGTYEGKSVCSTYTNLEGRNGKLVNYRVNDKNLKSRLSVGNGKALDAGGLAKVKFLSAYLPTTATGFRVALEVRSGDKPVSLGLYEATARTTEGRQAKASDVRGNTELQANSLTTIVLLFQVGEIGSEVTLPLYADEYMTTEEVTIKTG